ncbi:MULTISPECIES: efflux RND transporter permease subunit [unclassified Vibrio]|uniref:efflux RND transporter permease subunit n=1 Tax=unclassified Vibrio TaxID=2614977 RepID=UPI001360DEC8|nr:MULTISPECIES: efflux RND transporter permease subunit [unclassified Vibrio]NAW56354.1 MMPL family transporter [Vibrio sp. V36_P2S2PM302]NAX20084.1 MMPL family transporter [Vibrio sp. V39_P1S14PM300]NAX25961.1 MMPL family transporter [Vibrio sp. V38_P2S17PM301]NAX29273.1 MMPL family transporter [Vibrio sp. V37_P2S8PM304]
MNLAAVAINNRIVTLVLTVVMFVSGVLSYLNMSRLEDPEFTIKEALVITSYPGASALEVEQEVSDELEQAIQQLGQLERVKSKSERGLSTITVKVKDEYDKSTLPQVWDELRRKINDAQASLPPGASQSIVMDDYGDVYSAFLVVTGKDYSYAELKRYVDTLKRELLLVKDVGKVTTFAERQEAIYVEFNRDRLSQLGIQPEVIIGQLRQKGLAVDGGRARLGRAFVTIKPTGGLQSLQDIESLLISSPVNGRQIYLRDVAAVTRDYVDPVNNEIRFNGLAGIGLGISTVSGGNVVTMGEALLSRLAELENQRPVGIQVNTVSFQSDSVQNAISGFVTSLIEATAIVIVVLLLFMGLRSGLLIGFILILTIVGSFLFLAPFGVALERVSLGALIIALGMLVDNAIVVVDGVLIRMQKGKPAKEASIDVVRESAWPLLGATLIAILAFAAIGTSNDETGEFCRSLFQVVLVSLLLSWLTAVTVTPLMCVLFFKKTPASDSNSDPYDTRFYNRYKTFLRSCIRHRYLSSASVVGLFALSMWGFTLIEQNFLPSATRPQFLVDYWLPQGTHIDETREDAKVIEKILLEQNGVETVTSSVGEGALRFLLTYQPEQPNSSYAQFIVGVSDQSVIDELLPKVEAQISAALPDGQVYASTFLLGPGSTGKIQARISGPDTDELRRIATQVEHIYRMEPNTKSVRTDWRQPVKVIKAVMAEEQADTNGITHQMVAQAIQEGFQGVVSGVYRESDLLLPIIVRSDEKSRNDIGSLSDLQIWSHSAQRMIPLRQVVTSYEVAFEDEIIHRRDRKRTITVFADPIKGNASKLFEQIRPKVEALNLPAGYTLEWGGEYEDSRKAESGLASSIPIFVIAMILITIMMFNSLRQPLVIWLCVPLALIGVTVGLLVSGETFGFMALLGFLSLVGMLIKNAIVLIEQINLELPLGRGLTTAIVDASVSRLRPVSMAALTTALGMIPLIFDNFFSSMSVTIIGGLLFATLLIMIVLPVLYALIYRAPHTE